MVSGTLVTSVSGTGDGERDTGDLSVEGLMMVNGTLVTSA